MLPILFVGDLIVWLLTFWWDRKRKCISLYTGLCGVFYIFVNPLWRLKVIGRHKLPKDTAAIYVSNHSSLVDILVLFGLHRPFKCVSKKSNFKLPIIGLFMKLARYVELERGNRESVERMMATCEGLLDEGVPIQIYPEGTRSPDGRLLPFKTGAFYLAKRTGAPIYPIVIRGTGEALPKKGMVLRRHIRATVEVLDPLDPNDFATLEEMKDATRNIFEHELASTPILP
ncbi:MAG: 1-acyl-sn-glycerol-3-phosphate acyltransferase [Actinobacteria bacterium]|nr:1-acyl-sn-glycerol-3-phosphate acyltransferase [Actinomycetota bacterium]